MKLFCWIFLFSTTLYLPQSIIINELVSSNSNIIQDYEGDYPDWIELYNTADSTINLENYGLSDNEQNLKKWIFPSIEIEPNQFLLIFASGKNLTTTELHTNFKISSEGEEIYLSDRNGFVVSSIDSIKLNPNLSVGRDPNNLSQLLFFTSPTPGYSNSDDGYNAIAETPTFSIEDSFYDSEISVELSSTLENAEIFYTLNGSKPTKSSIKYSTPITINKTNNIRARAFADSLIPSNIVTKTFFINANHSLPILSLSTDPKNFWDDEIGIYVEGTNGIVGDCNNDTANYNQDWERPISIEFFETNKENVFNIDAGIKIHGGCTRSLKQKSLAIIARGQYGFKSIPYKIFPNLDFENYPAILLRSSGNDNGQTLFRDALMQELVNSHDLETQGYRPAVVYLNGEYFGIHNIREKHNADYVYHHFDTLKSEIDLLRTKNTVVEGDRIHYDALYDFIAANDLSNIENYDYVQSQMDIDNYTKYMISQMFYVNRDWYPNNTKFWRSKNNGKWRWIIFDTDYGFGLFDNSVVDRNMISYVQKEDKYPSVVFSGLLQNQQFGVNFLNTYADFTNSIFKPESIIQKIDSFKSIIQPEIQAHINKWRTISSFQDWENNVEDLKYFANNRMQHMTQNIIGNFELNGSAETIIDANLESSGIIKLNSLQITTFPWTGNYFQNISIELEALPNPGYEFVKWSGDLDTNALKVTYLPKVENNITAIFKKVEKENLPNIVINEIKSKSYGTSDCGDWIELYNNSDSTADLSNWIFKDGRDDHEFIFQENTRIGRNDYLVVSENRSELLINKPDIENIIGDFNFGINSDGELLRLIHPSGIVVDSVRFAISYPWPEDPEVCSIELINYELNNEYGMNWLASNNLLGTPGLKNSVYYKKFSCTPGINEIVVNDSNLTVHLTKCDNPEFSHFEVYKSSDSTLLLNPELTFFYSITDTFFIDYDITLDERYYYRIAAVDTNGFKGDYSEIYSAILTDMNNQPEFLDFYLSQNYPNPFNPETIINFTIPIKAEATIKIFDILGREIEVLFNETVQPGKHSAKFNGDKYSSGIYYYQLKTRDFIETMKMILIK